VTRLRGDRGEALVGVLVRFLLLALTAVTVLDLGQVAYGRFAAADQATAAARAAAAQWQRSGNVVAAYTAAVETLPDARDTVEAGTFSVTRDGTVSLTLSRTLHPFVLSRLGPTRSWGHVRETASARPPS
jgi:hypothetical protein